MPKAPINILLVEDNDGDILLTTEAFEERKILVNISVVKNGAQALDYIFQRGSFKDALRPDLVLLDINIPIKNGLEVLNNIKEDERTASIPVIMLTTSTSPVDVLSAYKKHANTYITKPLDMEDFLNVVLQIEKFWLQLVKLP